MNVPTSWLFYWLIAAVALAPIVLIVKGLAAGRRADTPEPKKKA